MIDQLSPNAESPPALIAQPNEWQFDQIVEGMRLGGCKPVTMSLAGEIWRAIGRRNARGLILYGTTDRLDQLITITQWRDPLPKKWVVLCGFIPASITIQNAFLPSFTGQVIYGREVGTHIGSFPQKTQGRYPGETQEQAVARRMAEQLYRHDLNMLGRDRVPQQVNSYVTVIELTKASW